MHRLRAALGLFHKTGHTPVFIDFDDTEMFGFRDRDRNRRHGQIGIPFFVKTEHLADVHPIDVIASKNTDMLRIGIFDEVHVLVNGIRGAFIPTFPHPHLRRYRIDEMPPESGYPPAFPEMLHQ